MVGLENLFDTKLEPYEILTEKEMSKETYYENVARTLAELGVNGYNEKTAREALERARKDTIGCDLWLYCAIEYFNRKGLSTYDVFSAATLLSYIITGWYGGFGTESYRKERAIEQRWQAIENALISLNCKAETIAKIAVLFLEDQYRKDEDEFKNDKLSDVYFQVVPPKNK